MTSVLSYQSVAGPNVYWGTGTADASTRTDQTVNDGATNELLFRTLNAGAGAVGTTGDAASAFIQNATPGVLQCKLAGMYAINYRVSCTPGAVPLDSMSFWLQVERFGVQGTGATGFVYRYAQSALSLTSAANIGTHFFSGCAVLYLMPADIIAVVCTNNTGAALAISFNADAGDAKNPDCALMIERLA